MMPDHLVYRDYLPSDMRAVNGLWEVCGLTRPWNDPQRDIKRKLTDSNGAFWVVGQGEDVVASVMIGYDGHRGSINYLAITPRLQRSGLGAELMLRVEAYLS